MSSTLMDLLDPVTFAFLITGGMREGNIVGRSAKEPGHYWRKSKFKCLILEDIGNLVTPTSLSYVREDMWLTVPTCLFSKVFT